MSCAGRIGTWGELGVWVPGLTFFFVRRVPVWEDFDRLPYINCIVKEGVRIRPVYVLYWKCASVDELLTCRKRRTRRAS